MLITVEDLKNNYSEYNFSNFTDERLKRKLLAIEQAIRKHTHNNFIKKGTTTDCTTDGNYILGDFTSYNIGDTVEIYNSGINDGLYVVEEKPSDSEIALDEEIYQCKEMKIAKIEYPYDVVDGCVELLDYDCNYRNKSKRGIASETISRHSVSYIQANNSNTLKGYPAHLLGFLEPYVRWRT